MYCTRSSSIFTSLFQQNQNIMKRTRKLNPHILSTLQYSAFTSSSNDSSNKDKNDTITDKLISLKNKKNDMINMKGYKKVMATPVPFPLFPDLKSTIPIPRGYNFKKGEKEIAYFFVKDPNQSSKITSLDDIHKVGTYGKAISLSSCILNPRTGHPFSVINHSSIDIIALKTIEAINIQNGYVHIKDYGDKNIHSLSYKSMSDSLRKIFLSLRKEIHTLNNLRFQYKPDLPTFPYNRVANTVEELRALVGILFQYEPHKLQSILELKTIPEILDALNNLVMREKTINKLLSEAKANVVNMAYENNEKIYLNEQMNIIKKKLGQEKDNKSILLKKFKDRISKMENLGEEIKQVLDDELMKFSLLESNQGEFEVVRNYLDNLTLFPWGKYSKDNFELDVAQKIMDEDHFGLKDVKDRIIEFIAVGKLRSHKSKESLNKLKLSRGKILCFVGPPGVGKTSMGRSIAHALNRKFIQMSVGGMDDANEIKGHRRTYVGAMPGKIIQLIKRAKTLNPLFMIDEIDKIATFSHRGDPSSSLLEILDPAQNKTFVDHYMDVPVDLSNVLFICTANITSTISSPLADRMEFIELTGYLNSEKMEIAKRYLTPTSLKDSGLENKKVSISARVIEILIKWYCREAGVRSLERFIQRIHRKAAVEIVKSEVPNIEINPDNMEKYVGKKKFTKERFYDKPPPGVVMGIAWNIYGGCALYIETAIIKKIKQDSSKPFSYKATGLIGKVMGESLDIAFSVAQEFFIRKNLPELKKVSKDFFNENLIHIHSPEGGVPKDGPSAGITIATALISLATNTPVSPNISMTGELSLTGHVLPIGGVKEKIMSAKRSGIKLVILPEENKSHWEESQPEVKKGIKVKFVSKFDEVFDIVFSKEKDLNKGVSDNKVNGELRSE